MGELVVIAMAVVAITLIVGVSINGIVDKVMRERRLRDEAKAAPRGDALEDLSERTRIIEDRLVNVERIVTDGGYHLGAEIDALRDRALAGLSDKGAA
jgi:hypothetical protein